MRKLLIILGLISAVELQAQVVIQPGALVKTTGDVSITFNNINVVNNDAASDFSGSILSFTGATNTSLSGNGNWNLRKIILDKSSGMLQLESAIQISRQLQVMSGQLDLNTQVITFMHDAQLAGENGKLHDAELQMIGSDGNLYKKQQLNLQPGLNQVPLNVQQLGTGVYYVLVQTSEGTTKRSLIKR